MVDKDAAAPRTVRVFSWAEVSPAMTRSLLGTAFRATGQLEELAKLDHLVDAKLPEQAEISLGRPPRAAVIALPDVVDLLRSEWLPELDEAVLVELAAHVQLSLTGPDRTASVHTRAKALTFLRERRRTKNLHQNLRRFFVVTHKSERDTASSTTVVERVYTEPIALVGEDAPPRQAYDHQTAAWTALDELACEQGRRAGLLVLPTGSGKTFTTVHWLLQQMAHDPALRVLWVADQQELLEQAAGAFDKGARELPAGFERELRVLHGRAGPITALGDPQLDVACVTRQSVVGRSEAALAKRLEAFLRRPTVVVVDEAHHVVATSYERLLTEVERIAPTTILLGLTTTPWPAATARSSA